MTVRLADDLAKELEVIARLTGRPATAIVRAAIEEHIAEQRSEPEFQSALRQMAKDNLGRLSRFSGPSRLN